MSICPAHTSCIAESECQAVIVHYLFSKIAIHLRVNVEDVEKMGGINHSRCNIPIINRIKVSDPKHELQSF